MASHPVAFGIRPLAAILGLATFITLQAGSAYAQAVAAAWVEGRVFAERDASFGSPGAGPVFGGAFGVDWQ